MRTRSARPRPVVTVRRPLLPLAGESGQDADMELTKHGHACVVLSDGDRRLVIDPGAFTDPAALEGADAVLVTHEHFDHIDPERLRKALDADPALEVWTNSATAAQLDGTGGRVHVVGHG